MCPTANGRKQFSIRDAVPSDVPHILEIYAPFITDSITSLEYDVPSVSEMEKRVENVQKQFPWLICETEDGTVAGYAYASRHRERVGYQWIAETGIYISPAFRGKGVGRLLYEKLCDILGKQGYFKALAIISGANDGSIKFHQNLGFSFVGQWKNYGNKFGKWCEVQWYSKDLQELIDDPKNPVPYPHIKHLVSLDV